MKKINIMIIVLLLVSGCDDENSGKSLKIVDWKKRAVKVNTTDSLMTGRSYLSVYQQIYYGISASKSHDLTSTISMRNTNEKDTIYILRSNYYDTNGKLIRSYIDSPIFIAPLETIKIVISKTEDIETMEQRGANFIFDWAIDHRSHEPLFEGVMISAFGKEGLSFVTQGKRLR